MTREEFRALTDKGVLLGDGATGSNMIQAGMSKGVCTEKWICEHPQVFIDLKRAYMDAGSQVIGASTFTANRINLARHGLEDQVQEINRTLMQIGRETVRDGIYLCASVTTTSRIDEDYGKLLKYACKKAREMIRLHVSADHLSFFIFPPQRAVSQEYLFPDQFPDTPRSA